MELFAKPQLHVRMELFMIVLQEIVNHVLQIVIFAPLQQIVSHVSQDIISIHHSFNAFLDAFIIK